MSVDSDSKRVPAGWVNRRRSCFWFCSKDHQEAHETKMAGILAASRAKDEPEAAALTDAMTLKDKP